VIVTGGARHQISVAFDILSLRNAIGVVTGAFVVAAVSLGHEIFEVSDSRSEIDDRRAG
jgi:hypothetical protein